jgi:hypothetical protein
MMTKDQRQYVRYLRLTLGDSMRQGRERMAPLDMTLEQGYRWEQDETLSAMLAAGDLEEHAAAIGHGLGKMLEEHQGAFGKGELMRVRESRRFIAEAVKILRSIEAEEMLRLEGLWMAGKGPIEKGHEVYFHQRFSAAMRVLRLAWTTLFYATQRPIIRRMELTATQSRAYYAEERGMAEALHSQAEELAVQSGKHVEVYDADGEIVYVAAPQGGGAPHVDRPTQKDAPASLILAGLRPDQGQEIRALIASRPGITIREAAAAVGAELVHPNPRRNHHSADHFHDLIQLRELWSWVY